MAKSCYSTTTISGIVVLTVFATICSVGLLLYLIFGFKKGRERYGNRLLKKITPSTAPVQSDGCKPTVKIEPSAIDSNASIRRPERKKRNLSVSSDNTQLSQESYKTNSSQLTYASPEKSQRAVDIVNDTKTIAIRAANLHMFDMKLENYGSVKDICLIPRAGTNMGGELRLHYVSMEGLDCPTVEKVLNAAQDALLICSPNRHLCTSIMSIPTPPPLDKCILEIEPPALEDLPISISKVDCSAQVSPLLNNDTSSSKENSINVAVQVETNESEMFYNNVFDHSAIQIDFPSPERQGVKVDVNEMFNKTLNNDNRFSRSVPDLREEVEKGGNKIYHDNKEKPVASDELDLTFDRSMEPMDVQEIIDYLRLIKKSPSAPDQRALENYKSGENDNWEDLITKTLKTHMAQHASALSEEHLKRVNHFQEQFVEQCKELEHLGISLPHVHSQTLA